MVLKPAALALLVAAATPGQRSGLLFGHVEVRRPLRTDTRLIATEGALPPHPDPQGRRRSVVYLQTAPQGAFESGEGMRASLDQREQAFVPTVLAITTGTTVDFPNNDRTYHNVFSLSKAGRFDLGRYGRGHSKSVRFFQPGVIRVFCDIHSQMSAFILVFAHRYYATTDLDGRYRIEGVPPGSYTLAVWNDGEERTTRSVTVPAEGGPVEIDLVVE